MEKKYIDKQYVQKYSLIKFTLYGEEVCEDINYDELDRLLDSAFNNMTNYEDMAKNVSWIRTIFKDLKEISLTIEANCINNNIRKNLLIHYRNKQLISFEYEQSIKHTKVSCDKFSAKYNSDTGINFNIPAFETIEEYESSKNLVNSMIDQLEELENVKPIVLNHDSKLLCEIYKTFYQESPDFSEENINAKVQTMMSILEEFGITLEKYSGFSIYSDTNFPISINLGYLVHQLAPLGKINEIEEPIKLSEEAKNTIAKVGHIISEYTLDIPEKLIKVSRILYARRNQLSWHTTNQEIAKFTNTSTREVETTMRLVKRIDESL